jgi:hypothetical protein
MNVNVRECVKEREVKESVRVELVKAPRQARFILTARDIARSGFITTHGIYSKSPSVSTRNRVDF